MNIGIYAKNSKSKLSKFINNYKYYYKNYAEDIEEIYTRWIPFLKHMYNISFNNPLKIKLGYIWKRYFQIHIICIKTFKQNKEFIDKLASINCGKNANCLIVDEFTSKGD